MLKKLDVTNMPKHIGIIMDGNGRWATKRLLPRLAGHKAGVDALKRVTQAGKELGVKVMSFYAFSTENWNRDKEEVDGIFQLVRDHLKENYERFLNDDVCIRTMGDIKRMPKDLYEILVDLVEKTKNNKGLIINMGLSYGGRDEIARACNRAISQGKTTITEQDILENLDTQGLCEPDLIIRTSGEQRISNFMLYQLAYSEFYFTKVHWPDFDKKQLIKAIIDYQQRDRRFGKIKKQEKKKKWKKD